MPRPLWKGSINFGLVHIPIRMFKAASGKDIRFRELHDKDLEPLKQKKVCSADGSEVTREHVVKGYEVSRDKFVKVDPDELEALQGGEPHTVDIENFVMLSEVDPVYFESSYYLTPDKGAAKPYALLLAAMDEANRAGIARVVMRAKQHLVLLRASGNAITMSTLFYGDEVLSQDELEGLPQKAKPAQKELDMAVQLIEALAIEFDPENYRDEYRDKVVKLLEKKAGGKAPPVRAAKPQKAKVIDLVSALQASLNGSKSAKTPAASKTKTPAAKTRKRRAA